LIQAGSFKTAEQAERLLVELKLLALDPKISSAINSSGNRWYRVRLGPFKSRREMAAVRNTIISNGIEAMVMRRSPQYGLIYLLPLSTTQHKFNHSQEK